MANQLIPPCAPASHYPEQTYGDGNCLFRAVSNALTGNQDLHIELRVRTFFELCLKKNDYLDDQYLKRLTSLDSCMAKLFESRFDTSSVKPGLSKAVRISNPYDVGVLKTIKSGNYSNMWHMYALSNVIGCPISSLYPMVVASLIDRQYMNVIITPTVQQSTSEVVILWAHISNTNLKGWSANHFVPLVPETSKTGSPAVGKSSGPVQDSKCSPPPKKRQKLSDGVVKKKFLGHLCIRPTSTIHGRKRGLVLFQRRTTNTASAAHCATKSSTVGNRELVMLRGTSNETSIRKTPREAGTRQRFSKRALKHRTMKIRFVQKQNTTKCVVAMIKVIALTSLFLSSKKTIEIFSCVLRHIEPPKLPSSLFFNFQVTSAEVQVAAALVDHNIPLAAADTFSPFLRKCFPTQK